MPPKFGWFQSLPIFGTGVTALSCANVIGMALLAFAVSGSTATAAPLPSRAPGEGCTWRPFQALGLRLLVQECTADWMHYVFSANGDWIEEHRPSDDRTFGGHGIIRVLRKPADMPIEQAIMEFAGSTLPAEARGQCVVAAPEHTPIKDARKIVLTLKPAGAYARKIEAEMRKGPRDFGCGQYGAGLQDTYFEYHPNESRTRFLFVVYGMDEPLFDERNIGIGSVPQ